jgi:hypothetical protein
VDVEGGKTSEWDHFDELDDAEPFPLQPPPLQVGHAQVESFSQDSRLVAGSA